MLALLKISSLEKLWERKWLDLWIISRSGSMEAALECNAFRVLSLPADAQEREIYRQQQRIQNALELGDAEAGSRFAFLPRLPISPEVLLEAVHRIEKQRAI